MPKSSTRIYAILARAAPVGVILRRGPSKHVLLLKWHLGSDTLESGQWFKGRIYERRCDLSPSGALFLYFAAKHRPPYGTWTAISKPPWLTALALWPKGDAWGGGGRFESELRVALNHAANQLALADGFRMKRRMQVAPYGTHPGWGEDFPIHDALLASRGWSLVDAGQRQKPNWNDQVVWRFERPETYERAAGRHRLQMRIMGVSQKNDAWYWTDYAVLGRAGEAILDLPRTDWADWDGTDLVHARDGKLFRATSRMLAAGTAPRVIADLSERRFADNVAPDEARDW